MGPKQRKAAENIKLIHCVFCRVCGYSGNKVEEIEAAHWQDLGMPETLWSLQGKNLDH